MKKNSHTHSDEIDLNQLFKAIWEEKNKIILITIVMFLAHYSYKQHNIKPDLFEISLNVKQSKNNISEKFSFINDAFFSNDRNTLKEDLRDQVKSINKGTVLDRLMKDLPYNEELISVLKENDTIKEKLARLPNEDQQKYLYEFIKLFSIKEKEPNSYILKFIWSDVNEGKKILDDVLKLGIVNLQLSIFNEIENRLRLDKKRIISGDQERIKYLTEQKKIAKTLNIIEGQVDIIKTDKNNIIVDYSSGGAYYLRGAKAIEVEISFLENRVYKDLGYIREEMNNLKNESNLDWVYYNTLLAETTLLNNDSAFRWQISALLSIVIGLFYAFSVYFYQSLKVNRNKRAN